MSAGGRCRLRTRSRSENNAAVHRRAKNARQGPALFYGPYPASSSGWAVLSGCFLFSPADLAEETGGRKAEVLIRGAGGRAFGAVSGVRQRSDPYKLCTKRERCRHSRIVIFPFCLHRSPLSRSAAAGTAHRIRF